MDAGADTDTDQNERRTHSACVCRQNKRRRKAVNAREGVGSLSGGENGAKRSALPLTKALGGYKPLSGTNGDSVQEAIDT
jgi:hypothetical protein